VITAVAVAVFVGAIFVASRHSLTGLRLFGLATAAVAAAVAAGIWSPSVVIRDFGALLVVAHVLALVTAAVLYARGRRARGRGLVEGGLRPAARDFVYGVERLPVWLGVDLKMFAYRPSLLGLGLVNLGFAFVQWERHGRLATPMLVYETFTLLYVANYFHFEHGMRFTWDVLEERFGLALIWGDWVLVPFFYSLPGWYLVDRVSPLSLPAVFGLIAAYALGLWLFRGANAQKHRFRLDPSAPVWRRPPETIGGRLLVSGLWGIGRKLNYTGELILYYAWTLPCGLASPIPYLPALWLTFFLLHGARRDDRRCRRKYGALWVAYCARVRWRMIPFLY